MNVNTTSVRTFTQPENPNSVGLQQKVSLLVQSFFRSTQLSEFDLATLLQGQPNNEVLNKHRRDPQLCSKNEAYKEQICAGFSELSAFSTDKM